MHVGVLATLECMYLCACTCLNIGVNVQLANYTHTQLYVFVCM